MVDKPARRQNSRTEIEAEVMFYCPNCHQSLFTANGSCLDHGEREIDLQPTVDPANEPDATFPRFSSLDELTDRTSRWRWKRQYTVICALIFAFAFGRELGMVDVYWAHNNIVSTTETKFSGTGQIVSGDRGSISYRNGTNNTTWTSKGSFSGFNLGFVPRDLGTIDVRKVIQSKLGDQYSITASVEELTLNGPYWLPFYKSGTCRYRVRIQFTGNDQLDYTGELNGVTDFSFVGISSVRTLKQKLAEEISKETIKTVQGMVQTQR